MEKMLMNPKTGTVQSEDDWRSDADHEEWIFEDAELIEVIPDGEGWWKEVE